MKIKTALTATAALALTACLPVVLWTSTIDGAALTGPALSVATQGNDVYQLYPVDTQLHLRKLDSAGKPLWQIPVDEAVTNSISAPRLRTTDTGVVVGYQDSTLKAAYVKSFDGDGNPLWTSDLGEHASETLEDMAASADGSVTVALRFANTIGSVYRFDPAGAPQWEAALPACYLRCVTTLALDDQGNTLAANTEVTATRSYLLDSAGAQLWYRYRSTGLSTLGLVPNKVTATADGFILLHPFVSYHYNRVGTETWNYRSGSAANIVTTAAGNLYIPGAGKISKLDSTGALLSEIDLSDQKEIRQLQWREDLQRLIVLSTYESVGPEIDGTITAETGTNLSQYDAADVRKARYRSKPSLTKSTLCTPYPQCTSVTFTPGENWSQFATTTNRKLVVSGIIADSSRFAKAYKMP